jgi:hypothetical protein
VNPRLTFSSEALHRLEAWALEHYGSLEAAVTAEERYALWAVRITPSVERRDRSAP